MGEKGRAVRRLCELEFLVSVKFQFFDGMPPLFI